MNIFKLTFDIMDITSILITFKNFGLKITNYYELSNTEVVEFEGTKNQLKKWYNEHIDSGENFDEYFENQISPF